MEPAAMICSKKRLVQQGPDVTGGLSESDLTREGRLRRCRYYPTIIVVSELLINHNCVGVQGGSAPGMKT